MAGKLEVFVFAVFGEVVVCPAAEKGGYSFEVCVFEVGVVFCLGFGVCFVYYYEDSGDDFYVGC